MSEEKTVTKKEILQDFSIQKTTLENQIDLLNQRILALQNHILTLEQTNRTLEHMAQAEKDASQRSRFFAAIRGNIELLTKLYSVVKDFEDVRFKYFKEVDDVLFNKHKLVAVEIRRIDEKIGEAASTDLIGFFEKLSTVLTSSEKRAQISADLEDKIEYKL